MPEITTQNYPGPKPPFAATLGPRKAVRMALVGEAHGREEDAMGTPFQGASGQELTRILRDAGIVRHECFLTNVLAFRPCANELDNVCVKRAQAGHDYRWPALKQGKYLAPQFLGEIDRLQQELAEVRPNLIVPLGAVACWALMGHPAISSLRGTVAPSTLLPGTKVLPTYHPAAVLRNWALRVVVVTDFLKAARECEFPEIRRTERWVTVAPTMQEIHAWFARPAERYSVDIETVAGLVSMVGFARSPQDALVVPFIQNGNPGAHYWATPHEEREAWQAVGRALESPIPKVFQNGLYDLQYLAKMGFNIKGLTEDTMLLHHAHYIELQKGLGFMGSLYSNEASWKLLRRRKDEENLKRDD